MSKDPRNIDFFYTGCCVHPAQDHRHPFGCVHKDCPCTRNYLGAFNPRPAPNPNDGPGPEVH